MAGLLFCVGARLGSPGAWRLELVTSALRAIRCTLKAKTLRAACDTDFSPWRMGKIRSNLRLAITPQQYVQTCAARST
jgi:hypothetical protein